MERKTSWWIGAFVLHAVALVCSFVGNTAGYWGWGGLEGALGVSFSYPISVGVLLASLIGYVWARTALDASPEAAGRFYTVVHIALALVLVTQVNIAQVITPRIVG